MPYALVLSLAVLVIAIVLLRRPGAITGRPGMVVMPEVEVPASAIDVGNMPRAGAGETRVQVVTDFLASWRFCPVSTAAAPAAGCLEDAARQLLDALDEAQR